VGVLTRRRWHARLAGIFGLACALVLASGCVAAAAARPEAQAAEHRVKAAFVYKFGGYVEWPDEAFATPSSPLVIGVVGADALADALERMSAGRLVGGRPVQVRKLEHGAPLFGLHVVFIGRTDRGRLAEALDASRGQAALTVTESEDGLRLGSMINFVLVADKVRFDVALPRAQAERLRISSRLLSVARSVVEDAP
jgi:hypothetical protein